MDVSQLTPEEVKNRLPKDGVGLLRERMETLSDAAYGRPQAPLANGASDAGQPALGPRTATADDGQAVGSDPSHRAERSPERAEGPRRETAPATPDGPFLTFATEEDANRWLEGKQSAWLAAQRANDKRDWDAPLAENGRLRRELATAKELIDGQVATINSLDDQVRMMREQAALDGAHGTYESLTQIRPVQAAVAAERAVQERIRDRDAESERQRQTDEAQREILKAQRSRIGAHAESAMQRATDAVRDRAAVLHLPLTREAAVARIERVSGETSGLYSLWQQAIDEDEQRANALADTIFQQLTTRALAELEHEAVAAVAPLTQVPVYDRSGAIGGAQGGSPSAWNYRDPNAGMRAIESGIARAMQRTAAGANDPGGTRPWVTREQTFRQPTE